MDQAASINKALASFFHITLRIQYWYATQIQRNVSAQQIRGLL